MNLAKASHKKQQDTLMSHNSKIEELNSQVLYLENQKLEIEDHLESMLHNELSELKNADGSYKNNIRAMFQDLVLSGVGIKETRNVITSVVKNLINIDVKEKF